MNIRIWNAFASNNSGSYTIVGSFRDATAAEAIATELREVIAAHHAWLGAQKNPWTTEGESPLDVMCAAHGITSESPPGRGDDWPQHGSAPTIAALGTQVILHVDYTVTMPRIFGEYFYRRRGRVDTELDHAHSPLVWIHEIWWPWQGREEDRVAAGRLAILDAAFADDGPLSVGVPVAQSPSWTHGGHFIEADLTIAVVWNDPVDGARALDALVRSHGANMRSRVIESLRDDDPAGLLRPSKPAVPRGLFDLVLRATGPAPKEVVRRLSQQLFGTDATHAYAVAMVDRVPVTIVRAKPRVLVERICAAFDESGAILEIVAHRE